MQWFEILWELPRVAQRQKWASAVGKMVPIDLVNSGWPQILNLLKNKKHLRSKIQLKETCLDNPVPSECGQSLCYGISHSWLCHVIWQKEDYPEWAWPNHVSLVKAECFLWLKSRESKRSVLNGLEESKHLCCEVPMAVTWWGTGVAWQGVGNGP